MSSVAPKAYTVETLPSGYRPLVDGDIGKEFGVDLELDVIAIESDYLQDYSMGDEIVTKVTILSTSGVGEDIYFEFGKNYGDNAPPTLSRHVLIKKNSVVVYQNTTENEITQDVIITMTNGEVITEVFDFVDYWYGEYWGTDYFDGLNEIFYVKDIEEIDEELIGYRPLVNGDVGKEFGIDLDCKIYFNSGLSVPIYENNTLLVDWVFPDSLYMFELRATPLTFDGNDLYERFNYFQGGNLVGEIDIMTTYSYIYDIEDETNYYYITDYTLPLKSYINDIYYDYVKGLILVKDLDLTDEEIGYINGYEDGKRDYGGFLDGQWYTAEDYGAWEYNRGLSDSIDVVGVMVGGVFSSLTALGNVEVLPGLKIFYIVGIFVVFGVVGFLIQKKFGGDD